MSYADAFTRSIADSEGFWAEAAESVTWTKTPSRVLDDGNPPFYRWFPDGS